MAARKKADDAADAQESQGEVEAQEKFEKPLHAFFGPECDSEIADDGTLTRGSETFYATAEGDKLPEGVWQSMAERAGIILHRRA